MGTSRARITSRTTPRSFPLAFVMLVKKCRIYPKAAKAYFAFILLSWVGLHLAMFCSHMSLVPVNTASTPHPMDSTGPTSSSNSHSDSRRRTNQTKKLRSASSHRISSSTHYKSSNTNQRQFRHINRDTAKTKPRQQFTQSALDSSRPHAQKYTKNAAVSRQHHLNNVHHAFAAVDYLDTTTMMGDSDDDSLDTYYALDDDIIRGSGYKRWPDGSEPICSTPSFYRLYQPNCNEIHSTVSGYQWLMDEESNSKHHRRKHHPQTLSRYLGAGMYRQVFLLERQFSSNNSDEVVFKCMKRFGTGNTFEQRIGTFATCLSWLIFHLPHFNCFALVKS